MDIHNTQARSHWITRDRQRRNYAVGYGSILLLLCVTPCTVWGQTETSTSSSFSAAHSSATPALSERALAKVLTNALNPYRSQEIILLTRDDVQRELGLNPRQQEKLTALSTHTEEALHTVISQVGEMVRQAIANQDGSQPPPSYSFSIGPDGEVTGKGTDAQFAKEVSMKMQEARSQVQQEDQKQRDILLTPAQRTRLKELDTQWRGPFLLLSKIGVEGMKLSDAQGKKFQNVWNHLETRLARNEKDLAPNAAVLIREYGRAAVQQEGFLALMRQLWREDRKSRAEAEKQALAALSPAQQQKWAAWTGKPFNFRDYDNTDGPSSPR